MYPLTGYTAADPGLTRHAGSLRGATLAESLQAHVLGDCFQLEDALIGALMRREACTGNCHMVLCNSLTGLTHWLIHKRTFMCSPESMFLHSLGIIYSLDITSHEIPTFAKQPTPSSQQHNQRAILNKYQPTWRTAIRPAQAPPYPATHRTPRTSCRLSQSYSILRSTTCVSLATSC